MFDSVITLTLCELAGVSTHVITLTLCELSGVCTVSWHDQILPS